MLHLFWYNYKKKIVPIEFHYYYNHLKVFGFKWENNLVKYEITLSVDQNQIEKTSWCKWDKGIYLIDETTMIYVHDGKSYVLDEYRCAFKNFLKDELKVGETLYTDPISGKNRWINKMTLLQHE